MLYSSATVSLKRARRVIDDLDNRVRPGFASTNIFERGTKTPIQNIVIPPMSQMETISAAQPSSRATKRDFREFKSIASVADTTDIKQREQKVITNGLLLKRFVTGKSSANEGRHLS